MAGPQGLTERFTRREFVEINSSALEITSYFARNAANSVFFVSLASILFGANLHLLLLELLHSRISYRNHGITYLGRRSLPNVRLQVLRSR